jgi:hypothetical protein
MTKGFSKFEQRVIFLYHNKEFGSWMYKKGPKLFLQVSDVLIFKKVFKHFHEKHLDAMYAFCIT